MLSSSSSSDIVTVVLELEEQTAEQKVDLGRGLMPKLT
jgi:hypothetical protein